MSKKAKCKAIYAGSFDPFTNGHAWVVEQAIKVFDEVIVAIGENPEKKYTFSLDERLDMLTQSLESLIIPKKSEWDIQKTGIDYLVKHNEFSVAVFLAGNDIANSESLAQDYITDCRVSVKHFTNRFLVDFAIEEKAQFIIRGIRNSADFEYEKVIRHVNADINPNITTLFLIPPRELAELSSSFVKAMCGPENWKPLVKNMVPTSVFEKLVSLHDKRIQPR